MDKGIIDPPKEDYRFFPHHYLTRAECAKIIALVVGFTEKDKEENNKAATNPFPDVSIDEWYSVIGSSHGE